MAKKTLKKVDVKKAAKLSISTQIQEFFEGLGTKVGNGVDYGFTEGTLVLNLDKCDLQVKLITPKAGVERYEKLDDDDEVEENTKENTKENIIECSHLEKCKSKDEEICLTCSRNKLCKVSETEQMDFLDVEE